MTHYCEYSQTWYFGDFASNRLQWWAVTGTPLGRLPYWEEQWEEDPYTGREEEDCFSDSKLVKNKKERECMRRKRELLEELESLLKRSNLISESDKKKRFTFTVSKTRLLIQELERQCGSRKRIYHRPVGHTPVRKNKKASNSFIRFSAHYRLCFVHVLKEAAMMVQETEGIKKPSQKVVQKLAAYVWRRLQDKESHSVETIKPLARDCVNRHMSQLTQALCRH
jgi:hypothetical protein